MKRVLFVCVENACRSQMAEGIFNAIAREQGVGRELKAISAGSRPAEKVDERAVGMMKEIGIDISRAKPKRLTQAMLKRADAVITMGCKGACPATSKEVEDWGVSDPRGEPLGAYRKARDEIRRKVLVLLERLGGDVLIRACVRCGSTKLEWAGSDGFAALTWLGVLPVSGQRRCTRCGYLGIPIELRGKRAYEAFLRNLKSKSPKSSATSSRPR